MQDTTNNSGFNNTPLFKDDSLLSKIFEIFVGDLNTKLCNCFDSVDDSLFELAEKSNSNIKQTKLLDSMGLIREHRFDIIETFLLNIKSIFKNFKSRDFNYFCLDQGSNNIEDSLELIGHNALEETLAKTNLISKSEAAYHKHIFAFQKRFSFIADNNKLSSEQLPVSPYIIVNAFEKSINIITLKIDIKIIMYKIFERTIIGLLNGIYTQINDLFVEQGIIPKIKYNLYDKNKQSKQNEVKSTENKAKSLSQSADNSTLQNAAQHNNKFSQHTPNTTDDFSAQRNLDQNYQQITQTLSLNRQSSSDSDGNNTYGHSKNSSETSSNNIHKKCIHIKIVIDALTILQNYLLKNNKLYEKPQYSPINVKDQLVKLLHKIDSETKKQKVKQIDEDTIDLVGLLFQFIVEDRNLPQPIQIILGKLQLPYLKIALQDRNLFADKNHEARVLLDKLALASVGWSKESDLNNQFINKIKEITHHIIETEKYNSRIFEMLYNNFDSFLIQLEKTSDVTLKRTEKKAVGKERINIAKEKTAQILVNKISNIKLPYLMRDIIINEWSNVLTLMYLRFSTDSPEFIESVNFIDNIKLLSEANPDKKINETAIKKLLRIYEKGLKLIIFQQEELIKKKNLLKIGLYKIHQIPSRQPIKMVDEKLLFPNNLMHLDDMRNKDNEITKHIEKIINPQKNEKKKTIEVKYFDVVASLKRGTWVKFSSNKNNSKSIRAKLSWISPTSESYLFVNSRGYKMIEKSSVELAEEFKNKSCQILLQIALFDRALSSIAKNLKMDNILLTK